MGLDLLKISDGLAHDLVRGCQQQGCSSRSEEELDASAGDGKEFKKQDGMKL